MGSPRTQLPQPILERGPGQVTCPLGLTSCPGLGRPTAAGSVAGLATLRDGARGPPHLWDTCLVLGESGRALLYSGNQNNLVLFSR